MDYKVLMIDDDEVIAQSTAEYFNMFDIKTAYVTSFEEAVKFLEEKQVFLLLLDINLGDKSGFELCKKVRKNYDMPILFISARTSDDDVLTALNIGGDDYIKKPYTLNILLAKVKAILSRYEQAKEMAEYIAGKQLSGVESTGVELGKDIGNGCIKLTEEIILDTNLHKLKSGENQISLKAMEYKMLLYLWENRNRVVTKEELLKNVWNDEFIGEGTLSVHIRHLREKIEADPKNPEIIKTNYVRVIIIVCMIFVIGMIGYATMIEKHFHDFIKNDVDVIQLNDIKETAKQNWIHFKIWTVKILEWILSCLIM